MRIVKNRFRKEIILRILLCHADALVVSYHFSFFSCKHLPHSARAVEKSSKTGERDIQSLPRVRGISCLNKYKGGGKWPMDEQQQQAGQAARVVGRGMDTLILNE